MDSIKNKEGKSKGFNKNFNQFISKLKNNFAANGVSEDERFLEQLNQAHEEWHNAELYFQSVTEPDLIDYAIYKMEASKTKYVYLLKQAREMGIKAENVNNSL
ncbi:YaaL family protein [Proteiniborus sp.]|uniref:YaaL family protein n=1 Tax=Proteiniborus sp. TaxID=2079015 RepID=UPI0033175A6A